MGAAESLERIRYALARHTPWVEFVDSFEFPDDDVDEDVLRPPHIDDYLAVTADMVFLGRHLGYRIATLSNGAIAVSGFQLDRRERPRLLIRKESRWQTVTWFVWLLEVNRIRTLWQPKPWHLKDRDGKTVLSVA